MKRENGFTMVETLVATAILLVVIAAATSALVQAQHVTDGVGLEANTQENLRAAMHFMVRDLMQAGEGIPQGGVSIPVNAGGTSLINRPGIGGTFPTTYTVLPQVTPGSVLGQDALTMNPQTGAVLDGGLKTDVITVLYADNTLVSSANCPSGTPCALNSLDVANTTPTCRGTISATGLTVTFDPTCFTMPGSPIPIQVGNLMMFQNGTGTALEYVTGVSGQTITFAAGDPAGLNQTGLPSGTASQISVASSPTSLSRVWMVTYYIDDTIPTNPQLVRQVGYPNYPSAVNAVTPPQPIADAIENLTFSYNVITANPGNYVPEGAGNAPQPILPDTPFNITAVNVAIQGRSEYPYMGGTSPMYFQNNLGTQVSIRSLEFTNQFPTAP